MNITADLEDKINWLTFYHEGQAIYKETLAQALRDCLKPEYEADMARSDGYNTEQAFKKVEILEALRAELKRA